MNTYHFFGLSHRISINLKVGQRESLERGATNLLHSVQLGNRAFRSEAEHQKGLLAGVKFVIKIS